MRKDLRKLQRKDRDIKRDESSDSDSEDERREERPRREDGDEEPDMLSEDMRRELLRQKWEKEELENLEKDSLHYSDVRFDEARNHGAGFYAFSKDGDVRSQEQVNLKKLHEETDQARREREKKSEKRKRDMAERIRKIKQKRREKMGLPPLEDEPAPAAEPNSDSDTEQDFSKSVVEGLKMFRKNKEVEETRRNEIKRREDLRDWDVGKEGLSDMKKEWQVLTQQEWMDKQRKERKNEFAPPTAFNEAKNILQKKEEAFIKKQEEKRKEKKKTTIFPPPQVYESSASPVVGPQLPNKSTMFDPMSMLSVPPPPIQRPDQFLNIDTSMPPPSMPLPPPPPVRVDPMSLLEAAAPKAKPKPMETYSTAMRLDLHKKMQESGYLPEPGLNTRIINEMEEFVEEEEDQGEEEEESTRGRRAEVAPPTSMDYYASTNRGRVDKSAGFRSRDDMASAFSEGLKKRKL